MDALAAVAAAGLERETLREALGATLVKDEHDRAAFDRVFAIAFSPGGAARTPRRRQGAMRAGEPGGGSGRGDDAAGGAGRQRDDADAGRAGAPRAGTRRRGATRP